MCQWQTTVWQQLEAQLAFSVKHQQYDSLYSRRVRIMCRANSFENNLSHHRPWLHQKSPRQQRHQHNQQPLWRRQLLCIHGVRKITSRRAGDVTSVRCRYGSPAYLSSHQEAVTQRQHRSCCICSPWKTFQSCRAPVHCQTITASQQEPGEPTTVEA